MQSTEMPTATTQLIKEVAERRARKILEEMPRSRVTSEAGAGGSAILTVKVADKPVFREFIVDDLDGPEDQFVPSLLELRHITIHCPRSKYEARAVEERAAHLRRAALEENDVKPVTIHGFRYDEKGHEKRVF